MGESIKIQGGTPLEITNGRTISAIATENLNNTPCFVGLNPPNDIPLLSTNKNTPSEVSASFLTSSEPNSSVVYLSENRCVVSYTSGYKLYLVLLDFEAQSANYTATMFLQTEISGYNSYIHKIDSNHILLIWSGWESSGIFASILTINNDTLTMGTTVQLLTSSQYPSYSAQTDKWSIDPSPIRLLSDGDYLITVYDTSSSNDNEWFIRVNLSSNYIITKKFATSISRSTYYTRYCSILTKDDIFIESAGLNRQLQAIKIADNGIIQGAILNLSDYGIPKDMWMAYNETYIVSINDNEYENYNHYTSYELNHNDLTITQKDYILSSYSSSDGIASFVELSEGNYLGKYYDQTDNTPYIALLKVDTNGDVSLTNLAKISTDDSYLRSGAGYNTMSWKETEISALFVVYTPSSSTATTFAIYRITTQGNYQILGTYAQAPGRPRGFIEFENAYRWYNGRYNATTKYTPLVVYMSKSALQVSSSKAPNTGVLEKKVKNGDKTNILIW